MELLFTSPHFFRTVWQLEDKMVRVVLYNGLAGACASRARGGGLSDDGLWEMEPTPID